MEKIWHPGRGVWVVVIVVVVVGGGGGGVGPSAQ